ncbi:putative membrane protein [Candidatus Sulfopaludibacter sp. SbA3]|nr:putative membrane protein [Candidatus Sulfopaludibacter sp. SbA3]
MWDQVGNALSHSMTAMLSQLASLLPGMVGLVLALLISAVAAWAVAALLRRSLNKIEFDERVARWGFPALEEWPPSRSPTLLVARASACLVMFAGFLIGISAFDVTLTSQLVYRLFAYLPNVLAAVVVLAAGSFTSRFLARSVLIGAVNMNLQYARLLSAGVKWLVTVLAVTMALEHLGIGSGIIRLAFGILFGGIVLALALAVGLGSKELVSRSLDREAGKTSSQSFQEPVGHL